MVFHHGFLSFRYLIKGYLMRFIFSKYPTTNCKVLTCRQFVGFNRSDILGHVNNAKYIAIFEFARWEILASSGFNEKAFRGKVYPMVASTMANYYRELKPFCVVTIQTSLLGLTANGKQVVFLQHMYDSMNRLVATATFHIAMMDWKTNRPLPIRDALKNMGTSAEEIFLLGDYEMNDPDDFIDPKTGAPTEKVEALLRECANNENKKIDPSGFNSKDPIHNLNSELGLLSNAVSAARITQACLPQRKWFKIGKPEKKSGAKK